MSIALALVLMLSIVTTVSSQSNNQVPTTTEVFEYDESLTEDEKRQIKKCYDNEDLLELCFRCAKGTKAHDVFPKCCDNWDKVGDWCKKFVYFGIQ